MKINKKSNKKHLLILTIAIILVASGLYSVYAYNRSGVQPAADKTANTSVQESKDTPSKSNSQKEDDPLDKTQPQNSDKPAEIIDNEQGKRQVQMTASHNVGGDILYIRGGINNAVLTDGECSAILTGPNGQATVKPTQLLQNAATTDCKTIKVDMKELAKGTWKYKLSYTSPSTEGSSSEDTFEIK